MKYVLVVEDQRMSREYMERAVRESGRYEILPSISSAEMAIAQCARHHTDLVIMDVCTIGNKDGIEAAAEIKKAYPHIKIIIVTSMVEEGYLKRARAAGADSFWYKDITKESLMEIIDRTMAGEHFFPSAAPVVKLGQAQSNEFTAAEIKVLRLICEGLEYSEISSRLGISVRTAKYHVSNILQKTGYSNRIRLAIAVTNKKFIIPKLPEENE